MGKDVIVDRYARLYEIPQQLALLGHEVLGMCLSYYPSNGLDQIDPQSVGRLRWVSPSISSTLLVDVLAYPRQALKRLRQFAPDVLIGASDAPHVVLTHWLSRRLRIPYAIDLYDNFESFALTRIPGMTSAFRYAVAGAHVVTCTSDALVNYVRERCAPSGTVIALPSTVDLSVFQHGDKALARRELGLSESMRLIGTAGGLLADRGIGTLYDAYLDLASKRQNVGLVLAGPTDPACPPPSHPRVHYLGLLSHDRVARLFQALDVGVIYLRDTPFGRYCFPQKAYEMLACGLPLVAAEIGELPHLLASVPRTLYDADDADSLVECIEHQLANPQLPALDIMDWRGMVGRLDIALRGSLAAK